MDPNKVILKFTWKRNAQEHLGILENVQGLLMDPD